MSPLDKALRRRSAASRDGAWPQVETGTSVPRIIHQNMLTGWDALPPELRDSIAELKARNPGWEYRFHDAETARDYIRETYGAGMLATWERIDPVYYAARSDLLRYLIGYAEGGVYLDIKSTATRPLDEVIRPDDVYILSQWPELAARAAGSHPAAHPELAHVPGYEYVQWFLIAAPGHPFLAAVLEEILARIARYRPFADGVGRMGVLRLTGPIVYTQAIHRLRGAAPHRVAAFAEDLGLVFSIYGDHKGHRKAGHYSGQVRPVVRQGPLTTTAAEAWFGWGAPKLRGLRRRLGTG